ncbi:MAG: PTS sugar transporter subunit IIB [Traorella sp.]
MKKILLVCSAGMSTSMLVVKMKEAAVIQNYEIIVEAHSISNVRKIGQNWDIILLGPQVKYLLKDIQNYFPNKPIESIDMKNYGRMDGEAVLNQVKRLLE